MADAPQAPTPAAPQPDAAPMPDRVPVLDPETKQIIDIPSSEYASAVQAGFTPLSGQQALQADRLEYESSGAGAVAAGAAGYLRGLTGGVSDLALDRSGALPGQDLKALSEQNPIASGAGHVAGVVGGLVAGGEGAEALGAGGSALGGVPGVAAKLGDAAVEAIPGLADAAGGGSLLAKAASGAVRGAVETPFYGVGDTITEDVFDNKPLTAESLLAEAGKDAILGGATGGAFEGALGLARRFAPDGLVSAGKAIDRLAEKFRPEEVDSSADIRDFTKALGDVDSKVEDQIADFHKQAKSKMVEKMLGSVPVDDADRAAASGLVDGLKAGLDHARVSGVVGDALGEKIDSVAEKIASAKNKAELFDAFDSLKKKTDPFLKFKIPLSPEQDAAIAPLRKAIGDVRGALESQKLFGEAGAYQAEVNAALRPYYAAREAMQSGKNSLFERIKTKVGDDGQVVAARPNEYVASSGKASSLVGQEARNSPLADAKKAAFENYVSAAKQALDTLERGTYQKLGRELSTNQLAENLDALGGAKSKAVASKLKELKTPGGIKGDLVGGWTHVAGIPGVLPHHAARALEGVVSVLSGQKNEVVYKMARYAAKTSEKISRSLDSALSHEVGNAAPPAVATLTEFGQRKRGESSAEAYLRRVAEINDLRQSPERRAQTLADQTKTIQQHAPGVASQVQQSMVRRDDYLVSKMPKDPIPPGATIGPSKPYVPSEPERAQFERIHFAVTHPLSIADDLKAGRVSTDAVEAVKATSPEIYGEMARQLTEKVAALKEPLSFSKRMQISLFLGKPADYSLSMLGRTQSLFASPSPDAQPPSTPVQKSGLNHLKVASRSETLFGGAKDEKD